MTKLWNLVKIEIASNTYLIAYDVGISEFIRPIPRKPRIMAIVPIAAESWFSVRAETKIPIEINTIPTSKRAMRLPKSTANLSWV